MRNVVVSAHALQNIPRRSAVPRRCRAAALVLLCGCAGPVVHIEPGADLSRYGRLGALPFTGVDGFERGLERELARGLWELDLDVVSPDQFQTAFKQLGIRPGEPLGPHDLAALRAMTRADALVVGAVDCGAAKDKRRVSLVILDAGSGKAVFRTTYPVKKCSRSEDVEGMLAPALKSLRRALERHKPEAYSGRAF